MAERLPIDEAAEKNATLRGGWEKRKKCKMSWGKKIRTRL